MNYLYVCDFNQTLTNSFDQITINTINGIHEILKKNKLCILSYCSYEELKKIVLDYNLSCDYYSISSSRGTIKNKELSNTLNFKKINYLLNQFESIIYTAYTSKDTSTYIYNYQQRLDLIYPKENRIILNEFMEDIYNITLAVNKENIESFYDFLNNEALNYTILATDKNRDILCIYPKGFSKEDIIKRLKEIYPNHKLVGIGDSFTDYEFIKECDIKIAMKNSDENLKKLCDYQTELDLDNDGCITELLKLNNS